MQFFDFQLIIKSAVMFLKHGEHFLIGWGSKGCVYFSSQLFNVGFKVGLMALAQFQMRRLFLDKP